MIDVELLNDSGFVGLNVYPVENSAFSVITGAVAGTLTPNSMFDVA